MSILHFTDKPSVHAVHSLLTVQVSRWNSFSLLSQLLPLPLESMFCNISYMK
jgi:hypothetical protein